MIIYLERDIARRKLQKGYLDVGLPPSGGLLTLDGDGGMTRWERLDVPGSV